MWNGAIAVAVLFAFAAAMVLAPLVLVHIRAKVSRFMRMRGVAGPAYVAPPAPLRTDAPPLQLLNSVPAAKPLNDEAAELHRRMRNARWTAAALYLFAGLAAATTLTTAALIEAQSGGVKAFLVLLLIYGWPVILTLFAVAVPSFRVKAIALPLIAAAVTILVTIASGTPTLFLVFSAPPTLLLLLAANRWLQTIAPVTTLITLAATTAMFLALDAGAHAGYVVLAMTFIALFALGFFFVTLIARAYRRKWFGELSFRLGYLWTMFCLWSVLLSARSVWWAGILALAAYATITALLLPGLARLARQHAPANLLVLRTFGAPARSQRLFEEIGTRWRYGGAMHLIAGTDSAIANLDLDEVMRYFTFRFRSLYVSDAAELERRLAALDCAPDRDGRYRTNDFFCFEDTWKPAFTRLLRDSHAVLVDLGGFGPQNAGVSFELAQLLARRPLDSFVLVTDRHTNVDYLGATLTRLWRELDPSLPNARVERPQLRVLHEPHPTRLVAALCDAAVAGRSPDYNRPSCSNTSP